MNPTLVYFLPIILVFVFVKGLFSIPNKQKNRPPSPRRLPVIGNFHQLSPLAHQSLNKLAKKHGPIMSLKIGTVPAIVASSPEAAREIMKIHDLTFADRYTTTDVVIAPYGESWRQVKSTYVLQLLSNKRVDSFRSVRVEEIALMMNKIRKSSDLSLPVNLSEMVTNLTHDVVSRAAFGKKYGEGETGQKFKQLLTDYLTLLIRPDIGTFFPWLGWINRLNGFYAEVEKVAKEIDEFLEGVIEARSSILKNNDDGSDETAEDFLDSMLHIYKDRSSGGSIDRDSIKAMILTTFAAGLDTSSTFLDWLMTELLRHPSVLKKLQNEVREVLRGKTNIEDDDLEKMHYLKATVKEILRIHPPVPLLVARKARESIKIMGYDIDIGTMVMINAWAIGRDPTVWDEPEEFKPKRFLDSSIGYKGLDFELIPFGAGRRGCPGISFATAVNELVIVNLLQKFDWELPGGMKGGDLDMSERPGASVRRNVPLIAIASPV